MKVPRAVVAAIAAVVVLTGGAFTFDAVSASRVEAEISERIDSARVDSAPADAAPASLPAVTIGGPLSRWSAPDTLSTVSVRVEGVERPGLGPVAVEANAHDVRLGDGQAMTADSVTVAVQITGDSLASALGMRDLLVGAADDPSLAGGTEHQARLTGTLIESGERVSAIVDLVVDASGAHLVPVAAATGPGGVPDQDTALALRSTALTLAPDVLPLGVAVETLTVKGGTITATGTGGPATPPLDDLVRGDL